MAEMKKGIADLIKEANAESPAPVDFVPPLKDISPYLNPRTRQVYNWKTMKHEERPTKWNKLLKYPEDVEEALDMDRNDLEDKYDVNQIAIDLGDGYGITDDYGYGFQVTRGGEPWKRFINDRNETEPLQFKTLREAYKYYKHLLEDK